MVAGLLPRTRFISVLEALTQAAAILQTARLHPGRPIVAFQDNDVAHAWLASGYSPAPDVREAVGFLHRELASLGSPLWIERVPSELNVADHPSRLACRALSQWGFPSHDTWPSLRHTVVQIFNVARQGAAAWGARAPVGA